MHAGDLPSATAHPAHLPHLPAPIRPAGPIAAGVAVGRAAISGSGPALVELVSEAQNATNAAAANDAFQTVCVGGRAGGWGK